MNKRQRIYSLFRGLLSLLLAVILINDPTDGYYVVVLILNITLLIIGLKSLFYYITMARFMVEGERVLFKGIIYIDLSLFLFAIIDIPKIFVMLYLVGIHAISGTIDLVNSISSKKMMSSSWKLQFLHGIVSILIAIICIIFTRSLKALVYVYCTGLIFSAIMRIISSFRRTSIVYIQ